MKIGVAAEVSTLRAGIAVMLEEAYPGEVGVIEDYSHWSPEPGCALVVACASESGLDTVVDLRERDAVTSIVALVPEDQPDLQLAALASGADTVDTWSIDPETLAAHVGLALDNRSVIPVELAHRLVSSAPLLEIDLNAQEVAWLRQLAEGATVAELADKFHYSERGMYRQLADLYERMGARNRLHALILAVRSGAL